MIQSYEVTTQREYAELTFIENIYFNEEETFFSHGFCNKHIFRYLANANPHVVKFAQKIYIWGHELVTKLSVRYF